MDIDKIREKNRKNQCAWRARNPKKHAEQVKTWKQRNPDKVRAQRRRYAIKHAEDRKRYYEENKTKIRARASERRRERRDFVQKYKSERGCYICGEKEGCCLDFHHIDDNDKDYTIAALRMYSVEAMMREIEKCIILCSNCHRKYHAGVISINFEERVRAARAKIKKMSDEEKWQLIEESYGMWKNYPDDWLERVRNGNI